MLTEGEQPGPPPRLPPAGPGPQSPQETAILVLSGRFRQVTGAWRNARRPPARRTLRAGRAHRRHCPQCEHPPPRRRAADSSVQITGPRTHSSENSSDNYPNYDVDRPSLRYKSTSIRQRSPLAVLQTIMAVCRHGKHALSDGGEEARRRSVTSQSVACPNIDGVYYIIKP